MEKIHKEILGLIGKIDIDCRDEKDTIIIDLAGQLDVYNSHDVNLLIEAYRERGFEKFILNLEKVTYLDSSTISVFIHCYQTLIHCYQTLIHCYQTLKDKGRFVLAGLNGSPKEVFELAKLHDVFQIFPDVPSAMTPPLAGEADCNDSLSRDNSLLAKESYYSLAPRQWL